MRENTFPPTRWIVAAGLALVFFGGMFYVALQEPAPSPVPEYEPTNFVKAGTLVFPNAGERGQDAMYLEYPNPGGPSTTMALALDAQSVCATPGGAVPCMAMSVQFHIPFGNKPVVVEGIEKEARLVVRKIRVLREGEIPLLPGPGIVYIPWPLAVGLIEGCVPRMLTQTHSLNVHVKLPDGREIVAVEPRIDEVFRVVERTRGACGNIPLATE